MCFNDHAILINEIMCRPVVVVVGLPCFIIIIKCNRVSYVESFYRILYMLLIFFKRKFWRVNSNYFQPFIFIGAVPLCDMWQCANAVNAGVCPKINQYDFA